MDCCIVSDEPSKFHSVPLLGCVGGGRAIKFIIYGHTYTHLYGGVMLASGRIVLGDCVVEAMKSLTIKCDK